MSNKPDYVTRLESSYGAPSQAAFGSAVFCEQLKATDSLADAALRRPASSSAIYWERYGEGPRGWDRGKRSMHARPAPSPDIVAELHGIDNPDAVNSTPMILDNIDDAEQARTALAAAYDDPTVTNLRVFNLGDGDRDVGTFWSPAIEKGLARPLSWCS